MRLTNPKANRIIRYKLIGTLHTNKVMVAGPRRPIWLSIHNPIISATVMTNIVTNPVSADIPVIVKFLMRDGFSFAIKTAFKRDCEFYHKLFAIAKCLRTTHQKLS